MQHIPYIPKYTSNQSFKNDFTQSFSLAFIIRKNALILYSFSEEKEVQNGLFYHFIYKTLVVNWSNMLHREIVPTFTTTKTIVCLIWIRHCRNPYLTTDSVPFFPPGGISARADIHFALF